MYWNPIILQFICQTENAMCKEGRESERKKSIDHVFDNY